MRRDKFKTFFDELRSKADTEEIVGKNLKERQIICFCNNIPKDVIEAAIKGGCQTLDEIYVKTTAGIGSCGGSCRRKIVPLLETFLVHEENSKPE